MNELYLPDCTCEGIEPCRCHGVSLRRKTLRNALRAIERGVITRTQYEMWLKKYPGKEISRPWRNS